MASTRALHSSSRSLVYFKGRGLRSVPPVWSLDIRTIQQPAAGICFGSSAPRSISDLYGIAYIRRLDVVNRGFSGFNTTQGLKILPNILPDPSQTRVRFMAILFGSNDACFASCPNGQLVPLEQYKKNLVSLVNHPALQAHGTRVILVTPPPVEERRLEHRVKS
ncbi:hypothetical protein BGZ57DRAFT_934407 [Hyaloscypha finlandica]|nr:hypothetical protein BGZ57DRAFT_934407 [Hyaloscypha finlandica]